MTFKKIWNKLTSDERKDLWNELTPEQKNNLWNEFPLPQKQRFANNLALDQQDKWNEIIFELTRYSRILNIFDRPNWIAEKLNVSLLNLEIESEEVQKAGKEIFDWYTNALQHFFIFKTFIPESQQIIDLERKYFWKKNEHVVKEKVNESIKAQKLDWDDAYMNIIDEQRGLDKEIEQYEDQMKYEFKDRINL